MTPHHPQEGEGPPFLVVAAVLLMLAFALLLHGCAHAQAGDVCKDGVAYCDGSTALSCQDGHLKAFSCSGPKGCALDAKRDVLCDQSKGVPAGTPCFPEYEGRAQCAPVATSYLQCLKGQWVQVSCAAGTMCQAAEGGLVCR